MSTVTWRGDFEDAEVNALHADAFNHEPSEDPWQALTARHSLGWVTARDGLGLTGFVNVVWDGLTHAWIQDVMVARRARGQGIGTELVERVVEAAREARCEWLHVDFDDDLRAFYLDACGFTESPAGIMPLR